MKRINQKGFFGNGIGSCHLRVSKEGFSEWSPETEGCTVLTLHSTFVSIVQDLSLSLPLFPTPSLRHRHSLLQPCFFMKPEGQEDSAESKKKKKKIEMMIVCVCVCFLWDLKSHPKAQKQRCDFSTAESCSHIAHEAGVGEWGVRGGDNIHKERNIWLRPQWLRLTYV